MMAIASQITSLTIVYSAVYSGAHQRKHQSSASLAFMWGIHRGPVNSPHKWPVTRKMFPFDDIIMAKQSLTFSHPDFNEWWKSGHCLQSKVAIAEIISIILHLFAIVNIALMHHILLQVSNNHPLVVLIFNNDDILKNHNKQITINANISIFYSFFFIDILFPRNVHTYTLTAHTNK